MKDVLAVTFMPSWIGGADSTNKTTVHTI